MICSRISVASLLASSSTCAAALRERSTISSACSRASRRRSRYSRRMASASLRVRSAASIDSSIARRRLSSASPILGKATFQRMSSVTPNAISVQIITPVLGETRKFPLLPPELPPPELWARTNVVAMFVNGDPLSAGAAEEERDQAEDERVEHDRFGEREPQPLDAGDLVAHLRLAGDRLDHLAEDVADAYARADRPEPGADAEGDGREALAPRAAARPLGDYLCERMQVHQVLLGGSVSLCGCGAADVDGSQRGEDERLKGGDQHHLEDEE